MSHHKFESFEPAGSTANTGLITLLFTLDDSSGSPQRALTIFKEQGISLKHIESRPSRNFEWEHDFIVELGSLPSDQLEVLKVALSKIAKNVNFIGGLPDVQNRRMVLRRGALSQIAFSRCGPVVPEEDKRPGLFRHQSPGVRQ